MAGDDTMIDDRLDHYLSDRARRIDLPAADRGALDRRVTRRRRTRRAATATTALAALVAGAVVVPRLGDGPGDGPGEVATVSPGAVPLSPGDTGPDGAAAALEWSLVAPDSGLGPVRGALAATDDGAVYGLSTAAGEVVSDDTRPRLYRSDDGAEWSEVALPDDLWATSLAGAGDRLYAVGTAPAGGRSDLRLATSNDGGSSWTDAEIESSVADLLDRYPGEVRLETPTVAVHDGTTVVSATVVAWPDLEERLGDTLPGGSIVVDVTEAGVVVGSPPDGCAAPVAPTVPPTTLAEGGTPAVTVPCGDAADVEASEQTHTWADLGLDEEFADVAVHGRSVVAVSDGEGRLTPVDVPAGVVTHGGVVATDDGFTLFLSDASAGGSTAVATSADGATWQEAGALDGRLVDAGTVGGRPAAAVAGPEADPVVKVLAADGSWATVDPRTALDAPEGAVVRDVEIGPLGWVAIVAPDSAPGGAGAPHAVVVYSVGGAAPRVAPLDDVVDPAEFQPTFLAVTADAVVVRMTDTGTWDEDRVPDQRVVVGTPG